VSQLEGAEQFIALQTEPEPAMTRIAMIVPLVEGSGERARALVSSDPPLDPAAFAIEKQEVFVTDSEIAFVFETSDRGILERLAGPTSWVAAPEWREIVAGKPHVARVGYSWSRSEDKTTGLAFTPTPGPGYSEGGDVFAPEGGRPPPRSYSSYRNCPRPPFAVKSSLHGIRGTAHQQ
jgi:hypothetical protein